MVSAATTATSTAAATHIHPGTAMHPNPNQTVNPIHQPEYVTSSSLGVLSLPLARTRGRIPGLVGFRGGYTRRSASSLTPARHTPAQRVGGHGDQQDGERGGQPGGVDPGRDPVPGQRPTSAAP